jgi:IS4 transposase
VDWYRQRWVIEQLYRILKKQGLNLESSQLEDAQSLMLLQPLVFIMQKCCVDAYAPKVGIQH